MTDTVKLDIEKRDESKNPRELRSQGFIPGTIYGKGVDSISVQVEKRYFVNTYKKSPDAVFEINIDNKSYSTNIVNIQKNYATNDNLNIEFKIV